MDQPCTGAPAPQNIVGRVLLESKLSSRPKHGKVTVSGAAWTYSPAKGFVGNDSFTIERNYISNEQLFVIFIDVSMSVRR